MRADLVKNIENLYNQRKRLGVKNGLLISNDHKKATKACQVEIDLILKNTQDSVIVIDFHGEYQNYCHDNQGRYIEISINDVSLEPDIVEKNQLLVIGIQSNDEDSKLTAALKVLEWSYQVMCKNKEQKKYTWLYIADVGNLIYEEYLFFMLATSCKEMGLITIVGKNENLIVEDKRVFRVLMNCHYACVFDQVEQVKENLSREFLLDSSTVRLDIEEMCWFILYIE